MRRALVIAVALLLPLLAAACGGGEDKTTAPNTVEGQGSVQETATGETTETAGEGGQGEGEGESQGDADKGKEIFASAGCGGCHTLSAAGSSGTTGPNLDDVKPSFDDTAAQVENGGGGMPAFGDRLSEQEIKDVAAFVSESAGG